MPERIAKLKATLQELEDELGSLETIDEETRAVLEEAAQDIHAAIQERGSEIEDHDFSEQLQTAAARFESSHPTLFGIVSRTIDALGQMGI